MSISRRFLQPINLLNATSDPTPAIQGDIYYNSVSDKIRFYDGTQWNDVGTGGGTTSGAVQTDVALSNSWWLGV